MAGEREFRGPIFGPILALPDRDQRLRRHAPPSFVDAFERYDMDALVSLLHEDAVMSMPPFDLWLQGADQVVAWMTGPGIGCKGSRLIPVESSGAAGFASYKPAGSGRFEAWALQVIEVRGGLISGHHNFLHPELFEDFGLPAGLEG